MAPTDDQWFAHPDIKHCIQTRQITHLRRIANSTNGNPRYEVVFDFLDHIVMRTAADHYPFGGKDASDFRGKIATYCVGPRGTILWIREPTHIARERYLMRELQRKSRFAIRADESADDTPTA